MRLQAPRRRILLPALLAVWGSCAGVASATPPGSRTGVPAHPRQLRFEERPFAVPDPAPLRHRLSNGTVVYVAADPTLPLVDVAVALRAGEYLDPPGRTGLAALTASMLRRGGAGELSADAFDDQADFLAAEIDSGAGTLRAGASLDCTSRVLPQALDLFFAMLRRPRFDPGRLELARSNLLDSMANRGDDPLEVLGREWGWQLYGREHPAARLLTPGELAAIERDDLVAFHRRYWHPRNMVMAVSGDVEPAAAVAALEERLAGWEPGEPAPWPPAAPDHRPQPGLYHAERDIPQGKVFLGHLGGVRDGWDDPRFYALAVMNEVLGGGGAAARIAGRLRTVEGLAYRVGSTFGVGDFWPGQFRVFIETEGAKLPRAVGLAVEEVDRLRARPPGERELELAKRELTGVFPLLFDTAEEIAGYFAEDELLGRPHDFWRLYRRRIAAVTAEEVRRAAAAHLHPDRLVIVTAGRWREIEEGDARTGGVLAAIHDGRIFFLPERDPLSLEAR